MNHSETKGYQQQLFANIAKKHRCGHPANQWFNRSVSSLSFFFFFQALRSGVGIDELFPGVLCHTLDDTSTHTPFQGQNKLTLKARLNGFNICFNMSSTHLLNQMLGAFE